VKLFHLFTISPEAGARCSITVATSPELEGVSGEFFEKSRAWRANAAALDEAAQERLWALSEELLGLVAAKAA
jgi:hypothetical protein